MSEVLFTIDLCMEKYATYVEDEITKNSDKLNEIVSVFSLFSIAAIPSTILTGIYGCNFKLPFDKDSVHNYYPLLAILLCMMISGIVIFSYFKYRVFNKLK